jgi:phosphoglycerol transferase MdoB-like AlkP superfamily enzyme
MLLFWLDHETRSFSDLFQPGMLVVAMIYVLPAWLICQAHFIWFRKLNWNPPALWALITGIPWSFILVMMLLSWKMGRW